MGGKRQSNSFVLQAKAKDGTSITITATEVKYATSADYVQSSSIAENLWSATYPASLAEGTWLHSRTKVTYNDGTTTTTYASSRIGANGAAGYNTAPVFLYKRSASDITSVGFTDTLTYTFATGLLSSEPNGWSQTIPASDGNPLYVTAATAFANTATDTIAYNEWTTPVMLAENGADGISTAPVFLYKRMASTPAKPTAELTYTFATGLLSGGSLNGWSQTIPSTNGNPCWVIQATASAAGDTDTIAATEWSSQRKLVEDGANGEDGPGYECVFIRTDTDEPPVIVDDGSGSTYDNDCYIDSNGILHNEDEFLPVAYVTDGTIETNGADHPYGISGGTAGEYGECTDNPQGVSDLWPYEWMMKRTKGEPGADGRREWNYYSGEMIPYQRLAEDGTSITITATEVKYATSANYVQPSSIAENLWSATYPASLAEGTWLHSRTKVTYSDGTTTTTYASSRIGANGESGADAATALFSPGMLFVDADSSGVSIGTQTFYVTPNVVHNGTRLGYESGLTISSKPSGVTAAESATGYIVVTVPSGTAASGYEGEVIVSLEGYDGEYIYAAVGAIEIVAKRRGQLGKMCYIAGEYSDEIEYTSNETQTVAVEVPVSGTDRTVLYYLDASTNWVRNGSVVQTKYKPGDGSGVWVQTLNDYNLIRTKYLFADFANLGASVVTGNWQFSQNGVMNFKLRSYGVYYTSYANITAGFRLQQGKSYTFTIRGSVDRGYMFVRLYNPETGYSSFVYFSSSDRVKTITVSSVTTSSNFFIQAYKTLSGAIAKVDSVTVESPALYMHFDPLFPLAEEREIFAGPQSVGSTLMNVKIFELTEGMSYKIRVNALLVDIDSDDSDPRLYIAVIREDDSYLMASGYIEDGEDEVGFYFDAVTAGAYRVEAYTGYSGTTGTVDSITLEPLNAFAPNYAVDLMTGNLLAAGGALRADEQGVHVIGTMELSNGLTAGDAVAKYGKMELNGDAYGPFISMTSYSANMNANDGAMRIGINAAGTVCMSFASVTDASCNYVRYSKDGFDSKSRDGNTVRRTQVGKCSDGVYGIYVSTDTSNYVRVTADGIAFPGQVSLTKSGFHVIDANGGIDFNTNDEHKYCKFATLDEYGDPVWLLFYGGICVGKSYTDPGSGYDELPAWDENS